MVISGDTVQMAGSFPTAQWNATFYALVNDSGRFDTGGTDVCTADWCTRGNVGSLGITGADNGQNMQVWPKGTSRTSNCYAWYHNGLSSGDGLIASGIVSSGCEACLRFPCASSQYKPYQRRTPLFLTSTLYLFKGQSKFL